MKIEGEKAVTMERVEDYDEIRELWREEEELREEVNRRIAFVEAENRVKKRVERLKTMLKSSPAKKMLMEVIDKEQRNQQQAMKWTEDKYVQAMAKELYQTD